MIKYKTISAMAQETGYSEKAIRLKIANGIWPDGIKVKAPDGRILISVEGYNEWVENISGIKNMRESTIRAELHSDLTSPTKANNSSRRMNVIPIKNRVGS